VSTQEAIKHWRAGARESWKWASRMADEGSFALAIFHCHLAIEKALKALYMEQTGEPAPYTHSLTHLASLLDIDWIDKELQQLQELTPFSAQARYDDIGWVEEQATEELVTRWITQTQNFLTKLNCALDS
jgi:HEPN domain-containing protein